MKVIIPVAGMGTRLKPHTHTTPKVLLHVAGKPILGHILDELNSANLKEIILIIGTMGEQIVEYVQKNYSFELNYVKQIEPLGQAHAIYLAQKFVLKDEPVLIIFGDTIFKTNLKEVVNRKTTALGVKTVEEAKRFGVVELQGNQIKNVVEKSPNPPSNLAMVGLYFIRNSMLLFNCLRRLIDSNRKLKGEFWLTDALQMMIENGEKMETFFVDGWYDCGKFETLLATNRQLLQGRATTHCPLGSIVIPPVYISDSAKIEGSVIGPYVSIADYSVIKHSIIRDSIINKNSIVETVVLHNSIVGDNAVVKGSYRKLNVGDSSEVDLI